MSSLDLLNDASESEDEGALLPRRPVDDSAEMDITPMIDIVFLLLIFFLVCSTLAESTAVELPEARHGTGVDERNSVIITIDARGDGLPPAVYLGDGTSGEMLPDDHDAQRTMILEYVEAGFSPQRPNVVIKASKGVKHGEVSRVSTAAAGVEGIRMYLAVFEIH
jgi:biopolymer transport protein ExbD